MALHGLSKISPQKPVFAVKHEAVFSTNREEPLTAQEMDVTEERKYDN
jgi:hypothetical protein